MHNRDAIRRFEQLAIHLLPKISDNDRAYVASLLCGRDDAPPAVIRQLARDAIEIAGPILLRSPVLTTIDLLGAIAATGRDHHRLIAGRTDLGANVLRALAIARKKNDVADEGSSRITDGAGLEADQAIENAPAEMITEMASSQPAGAEFSEFLEATSERRLQLLGEASARRWRAPKGILGRGPDRMLRQTFAAAEIVISARRHDRVGLLRAFSQALEISTDVVARMVDDPSGEPLVLLTKAAGLGDADGRTVLLLANKEIGESVDAFFRLADLYSSLEPATAEAFIEAWRRPPPGRRTTHVPVFVEATGRSSPNSVEQERHDQRRVQNRQ